MKKFIILIGLLLGGLYAIDIVDTNTALTGDNITIQQEQATAIAGEWLNIKSTLSGGLSLKLFITLLLLGISTVASAGVVLVMLLKFIALFTPDNIDTKIAKIEDYITKYFIKMPITLLGKIRKMFWRR